MKIIFLDIDGVLNSSDYFKSRGKLPKGATRFPRDDVDRNAVVLLNKLVKRVPDVKFVLSSTWRVHGDRAQEVLEFHGFTKTFLDKTPKHKSGVRGTEIGMWIQDHYKNGGTLDKFVILDDDSDMGKFKDHLVQTKNKTGLQEKHIVEIMLRLNPMDNAALQVKVMDLEDELEDLEQRHEYETQYLKDELYSLGERLDEIISFNSLERPDF